MIRAAAALLLLAGAGAVALASSREPVPRALAPTPAQIIAFPEASGPPALSCDEARSAAYLAAKGNPPPEKPTPGGTPTAATPDPDLDAMPQVVVDGAKLRPADLPGATPETLPLQRLEGRPEAIAAVGEVMQRAMAGEAVRMSFFGASHVGGDFFTGTLRRQLQTRYGDRGHGFILPAALYQGYRGSDVNLCRSDDWFPDWVGKRDGRGDGLLGFAGMSVSASQPYQFGWVETTRTNPQGRSVSRFEVYTLGQPTGGGLRLSVDDAPGRTVSTRAATPTLQRWRVEVPDGGHRLTLAPEGDGEVRIFGVSAERDGPGVLLDAMGVRGRTAKTWLSWDRTMAAQGLLTLNPDLVVLAYGTNEAADSSYSMDAYRADLRAVLTELRRTLPDRACVLVGPSDRSVERGKNAWAIWSRTADVASVQRQVAPEFGCVFWDWQQATGGPGSMVAWRLHKPALAAGDGIHFTAEGYGLVADRFLAALDDAATQAAF